MVTRVALATAARLPQGAEDAAVLIDAVEHEGGRAETVIWTDQSIDWSMYDIAMLHSPWDYSGQVEKFLAWIDEISVQTNLVNPASLVHWNADKSYLIDLAAAGVEISPSAFFSRGQDITVPALEDRFGTSKEFVLKPSVGAGGRRISRLASTQDVVAMARSEMADEPCIVQLFEQSIKSSGELSAIYVDGAVTHAVQKKAAANEFRIHERYGGDTTAIFLQAWMTTFAENVVARLPERARIARIDFVVPEDRPPIVMEVEVIEPDLYLRTSLSGCRQVARLLVGCGNPT